MPEMICGIAETMVVMICGSAWISEMSSWMPAWMIWGMLFKTALMMPLMICGMAATMVWMMVGSASTSEVSSVMPVSMISGMESSRKFTMPMMTSGRASIRTGMASRMPCARPSIS